MSNIVIYGMGKTGVALKKMLQNDNKLLCVDDVKGDVRPESADTDKTDILALSPGVSPDMPLVKKCKEKGVRIVSELQLASERFKGKIVAITGTNGKTTVSSMLSYALTSIGMDNVLCGNIGTPFSRYADSDCGIAVVECSSFQLKYCDGFAPDVSIFTSVDQDHLDYHKTVQDYIDSKCNIFRRQNKNCRAIFNADDRRVLELSDECDCPVLYYSVDNKHADCYIEGNEIVLNTVGKYQRVKSTAIANMYRHNRSNALAVLLAVYCLNGDFAECVGALEKFAFPPHRLMLTGGCGKVVFVDDSKATNVHATLSALKCIEGNIGLILGGSDKQEDFLRLADALTDNVKIIAVMGQTAEVIEKCVKRKVSSVIRCKDMQQAVRCCYRELKQCGGTVLLSPACASFDMYDGYAQRGEHFCQVVKEVCGEEG